MPTDDNSEMGSDPVSIWTVGHSNLSGEAFIALLREHGVGAIADVRRHPGSRRLPQFGSAALAQALAANDIAYTWLPALGGRRSRVPDSVNGGWENASFQGYADHLATEEFATGLEELVTMALGVPTAIMCAEALWWRCHRRLIADVLVTQGFEVLHIMGQGTVARHVLAPPARLQDGVLTYPPDQLNLI